MNHYDKFLQTPMDDPEFSKKLLIAALEIRSGETGISIAGLMTQGDIKSQQEINSGSLRPAQGVDSVNIPAHLKRVTENWESKGTATLMRGTRLPDPRGSFDLGGVHVTPQIDIANAYACGQANGSTGIGRLLNNNEIGFVNAYEVPLNKKTYGNFQFEDSRKDPSRDSTTTLRDLLESMKELSQLDASQVSIDGNGVPSEGYKQWGSIANNQNHYELILDDDQKPSATYLKHTKGLIKIDPNNPLWDGLLARVQEASLRDFYEIKPLDDVLQKLNVAKQGTKGDVDKEKIFAQFEAMVNEEKTQRMHAPWEAKSLADVALSGSAYVENRSYISQGERVGSAANDARVVRPMDLEKMAVIANHLYFNDYDLAEELMASLQPASAIEVQAVGDIEDSPADRELLGLIKESSQCMLSAFPRDGLSAEDASSVVSDDLLALNAIQGLSARCDAVGVIGRNAAGQVNYKSELSRQNHEVSLVSAEMFDLERAEFLESKAVNSGSHIGEILSVVDGIATQKVGRHGEVVLHDVKALSEPVVEGALAEIRYDRGVGVVNEAGVSAGLDR